MKDIKTHTHTTTMEQPRVDFRTITLGVEKSYTKAEQGMKTEGGQVIKEIYTKQHGARLQCIN